MPYRAAMMITTLRHPFAIGVYGAFALTGLVTVFQPQTARAMTDWVDETFVSVWACGLAIGGLLGLVAIVGFKRRLQTRLTVEAVGAFSMAASMGWYVAALQRFYPGWDASPTKVLWTGLAILCVVRGVQALTDRRNLDRAQAAGLPANPSPLGDPRQQSQGG